MENIKTCFLCHKKSLHKSFLKLGYRILRCPHCLLYSLDFIGNYEKFLTTYYSKGFFTGGKLYRAYADYAGDKETILKNMKKYLTVISKFKKSGKLLDLGCAMGFLIEEAQKWKYDPYGIDVSTYAVEIAQKLVGKNRAFLGRAEELDKVLRNKKMAFAGSPLNFRGVDVTDKSNLLDTAGNLPRRPQQTLFDIITMFDLIEHLQKPLDVLTKIRLVLKKDGILVIQTGDSGSLWTKIMGKNWHFFAPPQHFYFYNQKNITELLSQAGFEVIKIQKMGKWVSLRYLFHMMRYVNRDTIGDIFYKFTSRNFLGQIPVFMRMNDNMVIIAKKSTF